MSTGMLGPENSFFNSPAEGYTDNQVVDEIPTSLLEDTINEFNQESIEEELYSYLGSICNNLECHVIKVGGYTDHIHILCMLSKKVALMKLLEELKSHSSKWIKTKGAAFANFSWQNGYGAFSVNPAEVERVIQYIANQKEPYTPNCRK